MTRDMVAEKMASEMQNIDSTGVALAVLKQMAASRVGYEVSVWPGMTWLRVSWGGVCLPIVHAFSARAVGQCSSGSVNVL